MDIRLPGMDGLEATRRIMSDHPTPIVVIAGSVEDSALKISMNALRAGALSVVEKPVGVTSDGYEAIAEHDLHPALHHEPGSSRATAVFRVASCDGTSDSAVAMN